MNHPILTRDGAPVEPQKTVDQGQYFISWYDCDRFPFDQPYDFTHERKHYIHRQIEEQGFKYHGQGWSPHKDFGLRQIYYVKWGKP